MKKISVVKEFTWPTSSTYPCRNLRANRFDIKEQKGVDFASMKPGDYKIITAKNNGKELSDDVVKNMSSMCGAINNIYLSVTGAGKNDSGEFLYKITHDGYR